jgi:hypothetical protein
VPTLAGELAAPMPLVGPRVAVETLPLIFGTLNRMAAWWTLAISVGGTLLGVLIGTWTQGRNSVRAIKLQSALEEKRKQYLDFFTLIQEWDNLGGSSGSPLKLTREELDVINEAANKVFATYDRMYFNASPEVMEVAEELYLIVRDYRRFNANLLNHFVKVARKDLGVGVKVPSAWRINRKLRKLSIESDDS